MKYIILLLILFASNCNADDKSLQVKEFIDNLYQETIAIASNKNLKDDDKFNELSNIFTKAVDIKWIGKFAMGRYYKELSETQRTNYDIVFSKFLINSYVPNFKKYTSEIVKVVNIVNQGAGEYLARTEIIRAGKQSFKVDYMIKNNDQNNLMVFDIIAEGISLINTKRAEFESFIDSSDINNLIQTLENKLK